MSATTKLCLEAVERAIVEDDVAKLTAVHDWESLVGRLPNIVSEMVRGQRRQCLETVLASGAVVSTNDHDTFVEFSPIVDAAIRNDVVSVRSLLRHRDRHPYVVILRRAGDGMAVTLACSGGFYEIVKEMLTVDGLDLNWLDGRDLTPLMNAVLAYMQPGGGDAVKIVRLLVGDARCDVNLTTPDGATALHFAASFGYVEIVRELLVDRCHPSIVKDIMRYDTTEGFRGLLAEFVTQQTAPPKMRAAVAMLIRVAPRLKALLGDIRMTKVKQAEEEAAKQMDVPQSPLFTWSPSVLDEFMAKLAQRNAKRDKCYDR